MTSQQPLLLVDIDGVLNVYGVDQCPNGYFEHDLFPDDDEPVRLAAIHGTWLKELGSLFELAWASGWVAEANERLAPILGLDPLPFVPMPAIPFPPRAKLPSIDAFVGHRALAWIDDIMVPQARSWAASRAAPTKLVTTDPAIGLQRSHVDELLAWAIEVSS